MKRTPAPWAVYFVDYSSDPECNGYFIEGENRDHSEKAGNARLMAAAPELLEAVKTALVLLDSPAFNASLDAPRINMVDHLRQALAKAEGRGE